MTIAFRCVNIELIDGEIDCKGYKATNQRTPSLIVVTFSPGIGLGVGYDDYLQPIQLFEW